MTTPPDISTSEPDVGGSTSVPDEPDEPDEPGVPDGIDAPAPPSGIEPTLVRRRRRAVAVVAAAAAIVVLVVGWVVYRAWDTSVEADLAEATDALQSAVLELHQAVDTSELVLADSDGRVGDDQVRVDLASVVSGVDELSWSLPDGSRQARTVAATGLAAQARTHTTAVASATGLVRAAVEAFELDQAADLARQAGGRLAASIADGRTTLDATAGQVLDDAVRMVLADALTSAEAHEPLAVDEPLAVVEQTKAHAAAAADLAKIADAVDTARQGVVDAQAAWQVEHDRAAAEQAAEGARRAQEQSTTRPETSAPSSSTNGSTQLRPKTTGGARAPATGGEPSGPAPSAPAPVPAPAPAPAPDQGGWVESGSDTWCGTGDTSGAEGTGGWC